MTVAGNSIGRMPDFESGRWRFEPSPASHRVDGWRHVHPLLRRYRDRVSAKRVCGGVVHALPNDLRSALAANAVALAAWNDVTPLARNEFICWVLSAKQPVTRERRIRRTQEELEAGQRRPCCWPGCDHREKTGRSEAPDVSVSLANPEVTQSG